MRLTEQHQTLLRWFFGPGASAFERSPMHAMLDRASMYNDQDAVWERRAEWKEDREGMSECDADVEFGWEPTPTAYITSETAPAPSVPDNEAALVKTAQATRGLNRTSAIRGDSYDVFAGVYGPGSEVWSAQGFPLGGLYRFTPPGKRLISRVMAKCTVALQLPHMLHNDFAAAVATVDGDRMGLFGAAEGSASKLLSEVSSVWNDLHREPGR